MCSQPHCSSSKSSPGTALLPWAHQNLHPSRGHRQEKVSRLSPHLPAQRSVMNTSTEQLLRYPFPCLLPATGRFIIHHLLPVTPVSHWNCSSAGGRARSRREQAGTASNGQKMTAGSGDCHIPRQRRGRALPVLAVTRGGSEGGNGAQADRSHAGTRAQQSLGTAVPSRLPGLHRAIPQ